MGDEVVFSTIAQCFAPISEDDWLALTSSSQWSEFLDVSRRAMQDNHSFTHDPKAIETMKKQCPLQTFIASGTVSTLFAPPSYAEKKRFASRHFLGGVPKAAVPIESLYTPWAGASSNKNPLMTGTGFYQGDSALYMKHLVESMGMKIPSQFASYPDHLTVELDLMSVLVRSNLTTEAHQFLTERFSWLTEYRIRLIDIGKEAHFYLGLIDVLLGIRSQQLEVA